MATYVTLVNWTDQGIKSVKETADRTDQVSSLAQQLGGQLTTVYWTQGSYDLIGIFEFPDDETFAAFALAIGSRGNIRT